jgi:hypothetical protein
MDRERKIFLCVESLFNISNDLKDDFEDYSNILLFIADNIARRMEKEMINRKPSIHENGNVHDLSKISKYIDEYMDNTPQMEIKKENILTPEEQAMEEQVDRAIEQVREEISNTGC